MWGAGLKSPPNLRVVKALASPVRAQILDLLARGPMSYTELMRGLGLSPDRDAGKFAYHLKLLVRAGLIRPGRDGGRYEITDLGRLAHGMMEGLEERISRRRRMVVRTSRLAIEEFDRSRIAEALIREAEVPAELASRIAREAEEKLSMIRVKYLTAPLIRELVNAILLEKGLEEYRHRMTRVGLPVYDVSQLLSSSPTWAVKEEACGRVLGEYALIGVLHRDVADAHLSGSLHIEDLTHWALGPSVIYHDLRPLLASGLPAPWADVKVPPPSGLEDALMLIRLALASCRDEVSREQVVPFFNVFLAPYARGSPDELEEELRRFFLELSGLSRRHTITLGVVLSSPDFLAKTRLAGPGGQEATCAELEEEVLALAEAIIGALRGLPFPPAGLVFHLDGRAEEELLISSHELAVRGASPVFSLIPSPSSTAFDGSSNLTDWTGDWELDLLRVGAMGRLVLNLPRIAYEARRGLEDFIRGLEELVELAVRASAQRRAILSERARRRLMPGVMAEVNGDSYMRMANSSYPIGFVGLSEACLILAGELPHEGKDGLSTAEEILGALGSRLEAYWSRADLRCPLTASVGSGVPERMAELDVERYGWARVRVLGPREKPSYTAGRLVPEASGLGLEELMEVEAILHRATPGGQLLFLPPEPDALSADALAHITQVAAEKGLRNISYPAEVTYCSACSLSFRGSFPKCPSCGRVSTITRFVRTPEGFVREPVGVRL
ncbi:hypothetical protein DRO32_05665, partial [Candidatus Bathyarchaeota archaeon]